jgi:phenylalanyl-tRNA synthetase beta chain
MRVPLSWLRAHVDLPDVTPYDLAARLTDAGLKVEHVDRIGEEVSGVVVARVVEVEELAEFKKPIRWVTLDDGSDRRQVICGATNFAAGDVIAYARPPTTLPGGFTIARRRAYDHDSDGMICSARELGIGEDHSGILVLPSDLPLGADVVETLGLRDDVLDIAVNPDRGYALSVRGVARELAIAYRLSYDDPGLAAVPAYDAPAWDVTIDDPPGCDRYVARLVTGLDPSAPSPQWLQRRLTLAGMRPISLAVDVTNHVMLDLGQPLHAFDRSRLRGGIVVRRARQGEHITTLDDVDRALDPDDLVITDDSGAIAIAGVMGGASTEIDAATTDIVLEAAHFDAVSVAYTARRHRLPSEASRRFERGVDDALAPVAAQAAVDLLVRLGGATSAHAGTDVDRRTTRPSIRLDAGLPGRLSGVDYAPDAVRGRLADIGCAVTEHDDAGAEQLTVVPPSWRPDLLRPVDLVEEVVRLEGYERLPVTVPAAPAGRGLTRRQRLRRTASRALADAGFVEVLTYPFVSDGIVETLMLGADDGRRPTVRVANPVSDEEPFLRPTLLPGVLSAAARNVGRGFPDLALYESGPVFRRSGPPPRPVRPAASVRPTDDELARLEAMLPLQPTHLAVVLTGARQRSGWWGSGHPATWADAIESARTVAGALGVELDVRADVHAPWHPGRCAVLEIAGRVVGHAGELHPRVVETFGLPARTCAMELRLDDLLDAAPAEMRAAPISAFPPATFDLALVVDAAMPAAAVADAVRGGAGPLLEDLRLFDVFSGAQVGEGRKSLAFALRLRAPDRTLTAEETAAVRDAAVRAAGQACGAVLRGA